jgi:hypothetical protein
MVGLTPLSQTAVGAHNGRQEQASVLSGANAAPGTVTNLDLYPAEDGNRRVLAVLTYLNA